MNGKDEKEVRRKLKILSHAKETRNVSKPCRYWGEKIMQLKEKQG
ncbi:hypothetical protein PPEP_a2544 [Pseudoalteromonas peptidolytica F12-50-A1]|uniref:Uncharacterized protein n=1 Tax=Pseudoalteromonas peptidolytica F12-50-A1 TaxID=1315280 RepID=A0A8I0MSZ5_9GAMM|nr:hypothetical protein [Pseudoalteromonas peptidolytica F12-50-A1]